MNGCVLPLSVKLPDYINKTEFMRCNLNPVVVLTDFRKSLSSPSSSPIRHEPKKVQTQSDPTKGQSKESFKIKTKTIPTKSTPTPNPKHLKRKRESWDPSVDYEVEKIVDCCRDKREKMWYLVKWKNWSTEYNTLEPIDNLIGCHYKLMKYFEGDRPTNLEIKKKSHELKMALQERDIYSRLKDGKLNAENIEKFSRECPDASQVFKSKAPELQALSTKILREYKYIVRCLIGMRSQQDPGLVRRGQNYKFLLLLIDLRRNQLQKMAFVEKSINTREQIAIENEFDLEDFPDINYIDEMKPGDGVELSKDPLFGCECSKGCSPDSRCCGVLMDSTFAYKATGKLRTSERIPIYECNSRCHCTSSCSNRVVQYGRRVNLCIFKTKSCGWGVKAMEKIPKGTFVCEYVGELIPNSEAIIRDKNYCTTNRSGYLFDLDFFTDSKLEMYCVDATEHGNVARFINHSCDPNLVVYPVWINGIEPNKHRLAFFARRDIHKDEEIQFDYENLEDFSPEKAKSNKKSHGFRNTSNVKCQCKAANCREWIFGNK